MFRGVFCKLCAQTRGMQLSPSYGKHKPPLPAAVTKKGSGPRCEKFFSVSPVARGPLAPIAAIVVRQVAKFGAMMLGMRIRRWWSKLSVAEKQAFWNNVRRRRRQIAAVTAGTFGLFIAYCAAHMEVDPVTGKRRLILFTPQQMIDLANSIADDLLNANQLDVYKRSHPHYVRALSLTMRVINANKPYDRIPDRKWFLIVVDDPRINAMVLPNGMIIVFSGLLNQANDEEVAVVLSHEIAHCLLDHHAVRLSREHLLEMLWLIPVTVMWTVLPIPEAILGYLLGHYLKNITLLLPYERDQETEADKYGLILAANACVDVRQAAVFWRRMEKLDPNSQNTWWLSTHPSHGARVRYIENLMPYALQLRQQNGCPSLDRGYWSRFSFF